MTKIEKRIAIVKDVLSHLMRLKVNTGSYMNGGSDFGEELISENESDSQKCLPRIQKKCSVCAIGSCMLSYVRLYDQVTIEDLCSDNRVVYANTLAPYFNKKQLSLIETAFEKDVVFSYDDGEYCTALEERAIALGRGFRSARQRLKAIMENILENNGFFVPPPLVGARTKIKKYI